MEKTVVELFAGVGGFRCGLNKVELKKNKVIENNNWKFVFTNQWEPSTKTQEAYECYTKRFGSKNTSNINIFDVNKKEIPDHSLLVGGFPCQDYSVARTLSGSKGLEGKKGVLWWAIIDTIKYKKPPFLLLENVDRLLLSPASQRGRDFGIILRSLMDKGYAVQWRVINAGDYGMPQKRKRTFIFAYHKSTNYYKNMKKIPEEDIILKDGIFSKQFPINDDKITFNIIDISKTNYSDLSKVSEKFSAQFYNSGIMCSGKIYTSKVNPIQEELYPLKKLIEKKEIDEKFFLSTKKIKQFEYLKSSKRIPRKKPNGEKYLYSEGKMSFPDKLDLPARTMLTSESCLSRMTHVIEDYKSKKLRLLTPLECERINGFPDNWTNTGMTDRKRYFMMGNALVVGIIERIGLELDDIFNKEE